METSGDAPPLLTLLLAMQQIPKDNFSEPPPAKRRRGRPSGSKNKPKPTSFLRPHVLQISDGGDIAEATKNLARVLGGYVSILTANGPVSSAMLKMPSWLSTADITLRGCYEIVSMKSFFHDGGDEEGIGVTMAGMNGEVVGGILTGPLVAAGKVVVVVAELLNPMVLDCMAVKGLDSGKEKWELRNEEERNEEGEFRMMKREKTANSAVGGGDGDGGDNDEWCRNWFGQCELEVRRCIDLSRSAESGSGFGAGGYDGGLFTF